MFVSKDVLKKEKDHIEGFAAEVAWVTHALRDLCVEGRAHLAGILITT